MTTYCDDIKPDFNERPSTFAERLGGSYASISIQKDKKNKGQFFTPLTISDFMGSLALPIDDNEIRILDPGCGSAILSCSLIEHLASFGTIHQITLDVYDTDTALLPLTNKVLQYLKDWLNSKNIEFCYSVYPDDFILKNKQVLASEVLLFDEINNTRYDYIISNPPYFKLAKDDIRTCACSAVIDGQTNIYALFMAVCAKLLSDKGQMIFITPRSFASGRYFQSFRHFLFNNVDLVFIHLFNTRKDAFAKDNVLQELVIMKFVPVCGTKKINLSLSNSIVDLVSPQITSYNTEDIINIKSKEKVIYLPSNTKDEEVLALFKSWDGNMGKYNIKISTGPVVAYRVSDYIVDEWDVDCVPLYWLHNVIKMLTDHPVIKKDKGQYIRAVDGSKHTLLPNKNYILLRRFSSKDDSSRLIAAPYFGNMSKFEYVGFENKLNYIYRPGGNLRRDEVMGIAALLDSDLFDTYFRTFNGNINVSATELRMMPLPPLSTIREIGKKLILKNDFSIDYVNSVIYDYFKI